MKYRVPKSEDEILPNKMGLSNPDRIAEEEYRGFLQAEIIFESDLDNIIEFDWHLVAAIHKSALEHLYEFAGELRQVNMSKEGFMFPAARYLPSIVENFEEEFLKPLSGSIGKYEQLIERVAPIHAELLFIHPFREGNGRTARLFANLIALGKGFDRFNFGWITKGKMPEYISAVQASADKNYEPMIQLFRNLKK